MRYFIAHLLEGPSREYHGKIVSDLATRFGLEICKGYFPSHITVKAPFEIKNLTFLKEELVKFREAHRASPFTMSGFGHFDKEVIFMDVDLPQSTNRAVRGLQNALHKQPQLISWGEHESRKHFHATIAKKFPKEKFDEIWTYLRGKTTPQFDLTLNNVALLRFENEAWVVDSVYPLIT